MATILQFKPQSRSIPAAARARAAEIVLFPGVRYDRWADGEPPTTKKSRPRRRRDIIRTDDEPA